MTAAGPHAAVLVVDDDPSIRRLVVHALERVGIESQEAGSGTAALAILRSTTVGAVLVDQRMPGMTGIELTKAIRALPGHRTTPVLFLSGDPNPTVQIRALQAGATDFVSKPVAIDGLIARIQAQLRLNADWRSMLAALERRSGTVSELAALNLEANPTLTARRICEGISRAHDGASVGLYSWADDQRVLLASSRGRPRLVDDVLSGHPTMARRAADGPWIQHDRARALDGRGPGWWACAPLRRGPLVLGVLAIRGHGDSEATAADQLLAAAIDYATLAVLHLGETLSGTHRARVQREGLSRILGDKSFATVFQPIVDLRCDSPVGYEALTRFDSGQPVGQYLLDADDAGMRPRLELALIDAALAHSRRLGGGVWMSVNLSPSVVLCDTDRLSEMIESASAPVVVELTENERIDDYPAMRSALSHLGPTVKVAVDDAGAGYASLRHVVDLKPHYLKLDRSWISGLEHDESRQALVAGLGRFCEHTGASLIAEGIETPTERHALEDLGVSFGQGYLLGRPGPLPEPVLQGARSRR